MNIIRSGLDYLFENTPVIICGGFLVLIVASLIAYCRGELIIQRGGKYNG